MAIKDPNVLSRVNTLNTNLENANVAEIEKNISDRLFNVLEGANNISVDSELYASINDATRASDIDNYINRHKNDLPHRTADQIQIDYTGLGLPIHNVTNTVINLTPTAGITDTQNAITNMNNAIAGLNNLPSQISTLRNRLQENRRILNNIYNTQSDGRWTGRTIADINNDITNETGNRNRCSNLINILSRIQSAEQHPAYLNPAHTQHTYYTILRNNEVSNYNTSIIGITGLTNYVADGDFVNKRTEVTTVQNNCDNNIRNRQQELRLSEETTNGENQLPTLNIAVPNGFGLFNTNDTIVDKTTLTTAANTQAQINNIDTRLAQLDLLGGQIETLRTRYQDNLNRLNRILALQQLQQKMNNIHPGEMNRRRDEFSAIRDIGHNHLLLGTTTYDPYLPNQTINVGGNLGPVNLDFIHNLPLVNRTANYSLCDKNGNPLRNNGGRFELQLEGGQTVNIRGISFDNTAQTMAVNNLEITPIEGLTFPINLDLNVRVRIHDNTTGLDIDHHKPIHLEINRPNLIQADREAAYDSLTPPMNDRIIAEYTDKYRENLENEAIWKILREGGNETEVNEIYNNETKRNMFIDRIRNRLTGHFPLLAITDLQTGFRGDITRNNRDVPVQYLLSQNSFQNYVRQSIPDNLKNYASGQINNNANVYRDDILQEFLDFQTDVANNRVDNQDNLRVLAQVPTDNDGPQGHPDSWRQRLRGSGSRRNNYTKFFQGRNSELNDQSLETEDGTIKYGVKVEVLGVNRIVATINIDGKDEPEIIEAANHDRLIRGILRRANTKDGEPLNRKLRCNIALSVLKAMVMMSPQRLSREIPPTNFTNARGATITCDRVEAFIRGGNLMIRGGAVNPTTHIRQNVPIFDENQFKDLHDINALENGVRAVSTQINSIMNATAQEYQEATNGLLNNWENRDLLKYNTAQWLRGGPVKRLRGRLAHGKTNDNFDFDTSVNEAGKSVNIAFNNGKFTVSGTFDGQEYNYEAKDLGSILRKKINRKRVFDGIELAMVAAINEEYVDKLRTNNLIQTENFAVADLNEDKTGKVYIFDEDGNLSYLEIEDRGLNPLGGGNNAGRIDPNQIPIERIRCNDQERREFFQNPFLAGRLLRCMRRRLALF